MAVFPDYKKGQVPAMDFTLPPLDLEEMPVLDLDTPLDLDFDLPSATPQESTS